MSFARHLATSLFLALTLGLAGPLRAEIAIQQVTSPKGFVAWLVEDHSLPFATVQFRFQGGQSMDAPDKRGAVNLMAALLEEGTGDLDAQGFAAARDSLAATILFSSDSDGINVTLRSLTENREAAAALVAGALAAPRLDADAIERVRGQVLAGIRAGEQDPGTIVWDLASAQVFGDHPYGSSGDGTEASVNSLTREDLLAAHRATITRHRVTIGASGDLTPAQLGALVDQILDPLPPADHPLPAAVSPQISGAVSVKDFPGPVSTILFGHQGLDARDPDFLTASLLNEILGGGRFSARLMTELREKRGLTYGIGTGLRVLDHAALITGSFQTSNENVAEALELIRREWARIAAEPIADEEVARAKTYMTGAYPLRWDGNDSIASILVGMQENGLPIDYPSTRNDRVMAITQQDLARVARRLFDPAKLTFFVVGQPVGLPAN